VKRVAAIATVLAAAAAWALLSAIGGEGPQSYRVDAIFDNAANLIPGQDVKIAGARAGSVVGVRLTPDRKARVQMAVDEHFAPFRSDADCTIQPQSLIGEKFIQCAPGSIRGRALQPHDGQAATVPLADTHAPVDLDLVFATFRLPYRERLQVLVSELGMGLSGRGGDLNALIRRANPAIQESSRVLRIVDADRTRLQALIGESDHIVGELARRKGAVADFIDRAERVTRTTASHRGALGEGIRRLPPLLAAARPALHRLHTLADTATPVLANLRGAAPQVTRLVQDLPPLADAAKPALERLGTTAQTGLETVRKGAPTVRKLRAFAAVARPTGSLLAELFTSMRQKGVVEGLQRFVYYGATATSRFDRFSHMLPAYPIAGECINYATALTPGCDAHFAASRGQGTENDRSHTHKRAHGRSHTRTRHAARTRAAQPQSTPTQQQPEARRPTPDTPAPSAPAAPSTPSVPNIPTQPATDPVKKLLDWVLGK
jgi:phospholipid/cholesterol/gamma-HCH transport system substrate-binding protein